MGYAPRPAVLVGQGVLLHDGREAEQREALQQVQLAGRLAADVGRRRGRLGLVRELEAVPPESPLPERPSEKPVTTWMPGRETRHVTKWLIKIVFFSLVFLPFLGLLPRHMEVPRLEVESEL